MKVFSVFGYSGSGKTTTIEGIIGELRKRNYSVGSVKEIHYEEFKIDTDGTNTSRHKAAGSQLVTARGYNETDILHQKKLDIKDILNNYKSYDYVVLEGVTDCNCPKILAARSIEDIESRMDDSVFMISGRITNDKGFSYNNIPVISGIDNVAKLVDVIEAKVFDLLPDFDPKCCSECGRSCKELCVDILNGNGSPDECIIRKEGDISLSIDGVDIDIVPFVQSILTNTIKGIVSELEGYKKGSDIEIRIRG